MDFLFNIIYYPSPQKGWGVTGNEENRTEASIKVLIR